MRRHLISSDGVMLCYWIFSKHCIKINDNFLENIETSNLFNCSKCICLWWCVILHYEIKKEKLLNASFKMMTSKYRNIYLLVFYVDKYFHEIFFFQIYKYMLFTFDKLLESNFMYYKSFYISCMIWMACYITYYECFKSILKKYIYVYFFLY